MKRFTTTLVLLLFTCASYGQLPMIYELLRQEQIATTVIPTNLYTFSDPLNPTNESNNVEAWGGFFKEVSSDSYIGNYSIHLDADANIYVTTSRDVSVTANRDYKISIWAKVDATASQEIEVTGLNGITQTGTLGTSWSKIEIAGNSGSSTEINISIVANPSTPNAGKIWADNLVITDETQ